MGAVFGAEREDIDLATAAGAMTGERFWPMPLVADYDHLIKSEIADRLTRAGHPPKVLSGAAVVGPERAKELFESAYDEHARRLAKLYANLGEDRQ